MKKLLFGMAIAALLMSSVIGSASAQVHDLTLHGYQAGGRVLRIEADNGTDNINSNYKVGAFKWTLDGGPLVDNSPLYCLDVFNGVRFDETFQVNLFTIPPDPNAGLPINTDQAAWIYQNFGSNDKLTEVLTNEGSEMMDARAQAVQLALWEISHESDWYGNWPSANWWVDGDFKVNSFDDTYYMHDTTWSITNDILGSLYGAIGDNGTFGDPYATWYQPVDFPNQDGGQGQIGDYSPPEVPEPGTFLLLGAGLLAIAGGSWRRRQKK